MKTKPTLLLHSCCAPCSSSVLEKLASNFAVSVFYFNPNIAPESEYIKRLDEQKKFLETLGVNLIEGEYNPAEFFQAIKGQENLGEKSLRCYNCYKLRLQKTFEVAQNLGFDYFTTTLSVSPHKNADWLNEIGESLSTSKTKFLSANFKKQNGYLRSLQLSKKYGFYRQEYCGCEMSLRAKLNKVENSKKL